MLQVIARSFMSLSLGKPIDDRSSTRQRILSKPHVLQTAARRIAGKRTLKGRCPRIASVPVLWQTHMPITRTAGMWQETPTCTSE